VDCDAEVIGSNRPVDLAIRADVLTFTEALQGELKLLDMNDAEVATRAKRLGVAEKTVGHALRRLGVSYKKNSKPPSSMRRRTAYFPREN